MGELGELLRSTREAKGLSLSQAEEITRIRSVYLQALEDEDFARLPHAAYVRGFVRNYATFLDIDPEHALGLLPMAQRAETETPHRIVDQPLQPALPAWFRPAVVVVLIAVVVFVTMWAYQHYAGALWPVTPLPTATVTSTPTSLAPTHTATLPPSPTVEPTVPPTVTSTRTRTRTPAVTPGVTVSVEVVGQRAWLQVWVDGQEVLARTLEPGAKQSWSARERIIVRSGNAGAVRISANSEIPGPMGEIGQVVEREWTASGVPTRTPAPGG